MGEQILDGDDSSDDAVMEKKLDEDDISDDTVMEKKLDEDDISDDTDMEKKLDEDDNSDDTAVEKKLDEEDNSDDTVPENNENDSNPERMLENKIEDDYDYQFKGDHLGNNLDNTEQLLAHSVQKAKKIVDTIKKTNEAFLKSLADADEENNDETETVVGYK